MSPNCCCSGPAMLAHCCRVTLLHWHGQCNSVTLARRGVVNEMPVHDENHHLSIWIAFHCWESAPLATWVTRIFCHMPLGPQEYFEYFEYFKYFEPRLGWYEVAIIANSDCDWRSCCQLPPCLVKGPCIIAAAVRLIQDTSQTQDVSQDRARVRPYFGFSKLN